MKIQSKLNTKLLVNVFPWVSLILVVAVFGVASKGLLFSAYNLKTIFSQSVLFIIGGLGLSFLFAQGAFDLSFGSVVCFASLLAAKAVEVTGVDLLIFLIPFVVCIGIGILNGLLYSRVGLVVFIQTLGVSFLLKGTFTTLLGPTGHIKVPKGQPKKNRRKSFRVMLIISLCPSKIKEENTMKQLTSYNRVAGYLNKVFDLLNAEFFESELSRPTITIQSTPKAYGHFSLREDTWVSTLGGTHEINIGAGTLSRPIEEVAATLLHEMVHYWNYIHGIQDCSRGNTYHNRKFKAAAEAHGLIVDHHDKYGWTITKPSDKLLEVILKYDLLNDVDKMLKRSKILV